MSILLDYNKSTDEKTGLQFGTRSGIISMRQPIMMDPNRKKAYRVISIIMSPEIPNIYSYNGFNNTTVNISKDGGATWITVQFKAGIYTIQMIQDAINNAASQVNWWINNNDPGFIVAYNPATTLVYTQLDSSKLLGGGQLAINYTVSSFYQMLGYTLLSGIILIDGLSTASNPPQLDVQSTYIEIKMSCILGTRWVNGQISNAICRVPINSSGGVEIIYPSGSTGFISPIVQASIPSTIESFSINFTNGAGNETVWLYGNCIVQVELIDMD